MTVIVLQKYTFLLKLPNNSEKIYLQCSNHTADGHQRYGVSWPLIRRFADTRPSFPNMCLEYQRKPRNTLFESFSTLCLCSAIVTNMLVSTLPPFSCQYQNLSCRMFKLSKRKTPLSRKNHFSTTIEFFTDSGFLKSSYDICGSVEVIFFALVLYWCKVVDCFL